MIGEPRKTKKHRQPKTPDFASKVDLKRIVVSLGKRGPQAEDDNIPIPEEPNKLSNSLLMEESTIQKPSIDFAEESNFIQNLKRPIKKLKQIQEEGSLTYEQEYYLHRRWKSKKAGPIIPKFQLQKPAEIPKSTPVINTLSLKPMPLYGLEDAEAPSPNEAQEKVKVVLEPKFEKKSPVQSNLAIQPIEVPEPRAPKLISFKRPADNDAGPKKSSKKAEDTFKYPFEELE